MKTRSPERLMLEALQFAQLIRARKENASNAKELIRLWREFDALAAEAIAALAKKYDAPMSEERQAELQLIGTGLGYILGMKVDPEETGRWWTRWGTKTGLGLCLILERFIHHLNGDTEPIGRSLAEECRALAPEGQKKFDIARRTFAQQMRRDAARTEGK